MATILAANTGNWSATGTWTGGVVPVAGDVVVANGKTVTIDTLNVTVAEVRNDTTGGATAGGGFNMSSGGSLTANVYAGSTGTSCVTWAGSAGQTATITGQFFGGSGTSAHAITWTGGNLIIGGGSAMTGGTGNSYALNTTSTGTFTFATAGNPGTITGGTGGPAINYSGANASITIYASTISAASSGTQNGITFAGTNQNISITATTIGSATANSHAINFGGNSSFANVVVSGNITGGSGASDGVYITATGTYNITVSGNITNGSGNGARGIEINNSSATVNATGNAVSSSGANGTNYALFNGQTGTFNLTGSATAGNTQAVAFNQSTGIMRVTRAIGNGFGLGSVGVNNVAAVVSNVSGSLTYVEQLQFGSLGNTPVSGPIRLTDNTGNVCQMVTTTGSIKTLVDTAATAGVLPATTDVRSGTVYASGNRTGTLAVPAASNVALGIAVDATTGTAVLTQANVRTAVGLASANLDTQLAAIPTTAAPTVTAIRQEMDSNSTRLSTINTNVLALPSAATIATSVWSALTSGIAGVSNSIGALLVSNINATISSRSTYDGSDTAGTTTLLSRLTSTRASAIDNLDQPVSSRLATSGYTAPPSAASVASAVWAASSRTLTAAVYSVSDVAAAVWSAVSRTITGGTADRCTLVDTTTTLTNAPNVPSASTIAQTVWGQTPASMGAGSIGAQLATNVDATVSSRSTYAGGDTSGTTTLLGRLTASRASALDNLDVNVGSRLAASAYTPAPTTGMIRTELSIELARLDQPISSRLAPSGTLARVDTLTNAPSVPSVTQISAGVRQELSPELARVVNSATTQEVAEIVEGALSS